MTNDPSPESSHSVTRFLARLKEEDSAVAREIWQRFFERLLPLARAKLRGLPDRSVDEEDLLVSVFDRFFRAARENRFAKLDDREDLWQILLMLTERKVIEVYRKSGAKKRGGGKVHRLADIVESGHELHELADSELDPEFLAAFNDNLANALIQLGDGAARDVALLKLEGYENQEIADQLKVSLSSVERKLRIIRKLWQEDFGE